VDRRPGNHAGPLLIAVGASWFAGSYVNLGLPVLRSVLLVVNASQVPLLACLLVGYPGDRRLQPLERIVIVAITAVDVGAAVAFVLTVNSRAAGCTAWVWTPDPWPDRTLALRAAVARRRVGRSRA
jgi:hypothetical protein